MPHFRMLTLRSAIRWNTPHHDHHLIPGCPLSMYTTQVHACTHTRTHNSPRLRIPEQRASVPPFSPAAAALCLVNGGCWGHTLASSRCDRRPSRCNGGRVLFNSLRSLLLAVDGNVDRAFGTFGSSAIVGYTLRAATSTLALLVPTSPTRSERAHPPPLSPPPLTLSGMALFIDHTHTC